VERRIPRGSKITMNYGKYFTDFEFRCKHCNKAGMDQTFVDRLNALREAYGSSLRVSSGYRCKDHPVEAKKASTGMHTTGKAVDFAIQGADAHKLLGIAMTMGFKGIGVQQKGTGRFIHLDDRDTPAVWSY
jgi:zinc D-Ala-D-Ala carboxypeptidase